MKKLIARLTEILKNIGTNIIAFLGDDEKADKALGVIIGTGLGAAVVLGIVLIVNEAYQENAILTQELAVVEQKLQKSEEERLELVRENRAMLFIYDNQAIELEKLKAELAEKEEEEKKEKILNDPNAKIVDLIQYIDGDFEDNVETTAHLLMGETRGSKYKYKELHVLMIVARAFDQRLSNGTGNLESAIFRQGQFMCVDDGSYYQTPDEDCYNAARQVLSGNVLYYQDISRNDLLFTTQIDAICEPMEE